MTVILRLWLAALTDALKPLGEVTVVAPERNRSMCFKFINAGSAFAAETSAEWLYYVNGTPTDCVHLAVTGMCWIISALRYGDFGH